MWTSVGSNPDTARAEKVLISVGDNGMGLAACKERCRQSNNCVGKSRVIDMHGKISLNVSDDDNSVAYVSLPMHPGQGIPGVAKKTVRLCTILPEYKGADVNLDFDANDVLIGIEILA